jgi:uncharacterized cupredoxin-like copper-binding protein
MVDRHRHDNRSAAAFSTDGQRAYVALWCGRRFAAGADHRFSKHEEGIDVNTNSFGPGDSRTITSVPPSERQLVCPIRGHGQQRMSATLTVVGP